MESNCRHHRRALILRSFAVLFLLSALSLRLYAIAIWGNRPLNEALDMKPNVVAATLESIKERTGNLAITPTLIFRVNQMLHAEDSDFRSFVEKNGNRIVIDRQNFVWPNRLSAMAEGQFVIALLDSRIPPGPSGTTSSPYLLIDVIPTSTQRFQTDQTLASIRNLIRTDLLRQLKSERSSGRQLSLLRFVFPLMNTQDAGMITPFLQHSDPEHQRAARALLLALTLDPAFISDVERDLQWIASHPASDRVAHMDDINSGCFLPAGFCDYAYLRRFTPFMDRLFPSDLERCAKQQLLPLFRWICHNIEDPKVRWELGIQPLSQFGTLDDLPLLEAESRKDAERDLTPFLFRIRTGRLPYDAFKSVRKLEETPSTLTVEVSYTYSGDYGENGMWIECRASGNSNRENHPSAFAPASTGDHTARIKLEMAPDETAPYNTDMLFFDFVTSRKGTCCGGWGFGFIKKWSRSKR